MAVSRNSSSSISYHQLPHVFNKERPFETRMIMAKRCQHKIQNLEPGEDLKLKISDITIEDVSCNNASVSDEECHPFSHECQQESNPLAESCNDTKVSDEECHPSFSLDCQREESNRLSGTFAPHLMALERIQEQMRSFLQEEARQLKDQPLKEPMSEQERKVLRQIEMVMFRNMKPLKLNQLLRNSLFHEICLKRIQIIGSETLEPLRKAILAAEEVVQTFQEKLLDHNFTIEMCEDLDNSLLKRQEKVKELLEDSVFFEGQLPPEDEIQYTMAESRISYALGLEVDFLEKLTLYDDEIMFHLTTQEWILNILSNKYEGIDDEDLKKNLSKELLTKLGFRENSKAIQTIMSRSALMADHVEPVEFAKQFVKDEIKYNPVFSQKLFRFPFIDQPNVQSAMKAVDVINAVRADVHSEPVRKLTEHVSRLSDEESVLLFHGTDHLSAIDIIQRGIDVRRGQPQHDFSDGWGFYLTNNYEHARTWSFSQTRKPAVLVFKVQKSFLESSNCLDLSKDEEKSEWLQIVKECRSGRRSKKLRNRLKTYDIIAGPISKRSDDVNQPFEPRQGSHQLCVINEDCADELREFLDTVIFYE